MSYMAIDQYGHTEHDLGKFPRKELLRRYMVKSAKKIYIEKKSGATVHIGWIVGGHWFTVYNVQPMEKAA